MSVEPQISTHTSINDRIVFLDGLRGLAIGLVVLYHAFARWGDIVPYHDDFNWIPIFRYGWLGVELFFLMSGFVILMTLEKCSNFTTFMLRRWLRLFPASLFISIALFMTSGLFPERPAGAPVLSDIIPGLVFMQPEWLAILRGNPQGVIEAAYWSLYVEVIFYFIFGSLYFLIGESRAITVMCCAFIISLFAQYGGITSINILSDSNCLGIKFFGWFMAGALIYRWTAFNRHNDLVFAALIGAACPLSVPGVGPKLCGALIVVLFFMAVLNRKVRNILSYRLFVFLGFISYPLYLLHENMLVALIVKIGRLAPWLPNILVPAIPMAVVVFFGWFVARFAEPAVRLLLRASYRLLSEVAGANSAGKSVVMAKAQWRRREA